MRTRTRRIREPATLGPARVNRCTIGTDVPVPGPVHEDFDALRRLVGPELSDPQLARILMAWTQLVGSVTFELFSHLNNIVRNHEEYFVFQPTTIGRELGLR
ncbi:hypothetical protein [Cryptosporangium japonicum]|uniref:Uncharacterized protein n=1 Tax=Cryptosporangium japonicum TaxID=80872 RepID=A0ABP3DY36_9ACTN